MFAHRWDNSGNGRDNTPWSNIRLRSNEQDNFSPASTFRRFCGSYWVGSQIDIFITSKNKLEFVEIKLGSNLKSYSTNYYNKPFIKVFFDTNKPTFDDHLACYHLIDLTTYDDDDVLVDEALDPE